MNSSRDCFSLDEDKTLDVVDDVSEPASARLMPMVRMERAMRRFCSGKDMARTDTRSAGVAACDVRRHGFASGFSAMETGNQSLRNVSLPPER